MATRPTGQEARMTSRPDYTRRAAGWLLGATAHPGGEALSRRLLERLALLPGARVVDVACGSGATLRLLQAAGHAAVGVDREPRAVTRAGGGAVVADAHALPLREAAYDAVVCECALSTFDDAGRALGEIARALRSGGRLGMTDVVLDRTRAAPEVVRAVEALTTARTVPGYTELLESAGLRVVEAEDRSPDALALARRVRRRLSLVGARKAATTAEACEQAVRAGALGYVLLVAERR
jgi:SAM-dependent methyltransferase